MSPVVTFGCEQPAQAAKSAHQGRRRDWQIDQKEARQLHAEDRAIRQQERAQAAQNGGHITKAEQRQLNREENQVSKQIYEETHQPAGL